jgi:hypothetical protein
MFCSLKDFRRIATRFDRRATVFMAAVCIAATVSYWLCVWSLVLFGDWERIIFTNTFWRDCSDKLSVRDCLVDIYVLLI